MPSNSKKITEKTNKKFKSEWVFIIILGLIIILFLLFPSSNSLFSSLKDDKDQDYLTLTETKLESVLASVSGVGKVDVMITLSGSESYDIAKNVETTTENGVTKRVESVVMVSGKPYVIKTNNPTIEGVVIVCEGADDVKVKMLITEAVVTALNVDANKIRIVKMK